MLVAADVFHEPISSLKSSSPSNISLMSWAPHQAERCTVSDFTDISGRMVENHFAKQEGHSRGISSDFLHARGCSRQSYVAFTLQVQ